MQQGGDPQTVYAGAFRRIPGLIDGSDPDVAQIEERDWYDSLAKPDWTPAPSTISLRPC